MENINGATVICGLIGNPVEHTVSPVIHNGLAKQLGHNLVYVPFLVDESLPLAIKGAYALNIAGLNITVPYKSEVMEELCGIDSLAKQIGAVNTLVRTPQGYYGYNTDMPGLQRAMLSDGVTIAGEHVIILGAGGAARAVAFLCASAGAAHIYLLNRTLGKAEAVAEEVNRAYETKPVTPLLLEDYEKLPSYRFLAIQGTSVGLYPHIEDSPILNKEFYNKIHTGYDLIYRPFKTKFMQLVENAGGRAFHGLKMLLYQGIIAYELWNDTRVTTEMAEMIYGQLKKEMGIDE